MREPIDISMLVSQVRDGNRAAIGKAITLVESQHPLHRKQAAELIRLLWEHTGHSKRVGITGVPGVGKSSFVEYFGLHLVQQGHKVAVLAVDPSSSISKGSILGDKTRMELLSRHPNAFIRPSPSGGTLGGVAARTLETMWICEAAGFDMILIETVGVGQSEVAVNDLCDFFLLLMLPGAGDELQGIKRGIMELADAIWINKCDGNMIQAAKNARAQYASAMHLFPPKLSHWIPEVMTGSAQEQIGAAHMYETLSKYWRLTSTNGYFDARRMEQAKMWLKTLVVEEMKKTYFSNPDFSDKYTRLELAVAKGTCSLTDAIHQLFGNN